MRRRSTVLALGTSCLLAVGCSGDEESSSNAGPGGSASSAGSGGAGEGGTAGEGASGGEAGAAGASEDAGPPPIDDSGPPPEVIDFAADWPMANRDYQNTRATFDATIDSTNIAEVTEAWMFEIPGGGVFGAATANPIILGDTAYYQDMSSNIFAFDLETGDVKWERRFRRPSPGPNGMAVGWGKIFTPVSDSAFSALDLETGETLWTAPIEVPDTGGIDLAPYAYDGKVYMSTVPVNSSGGYLGNATGIIHALDQETGEILWEFDTVDSDDIWGNPEVNSGGGAWYPPTIDVESGITYWGTGNPGPWPGNEDFPNGTSRPGDNLYTNSVLALAYDTGELLWYHQEAPHDIFDLDFQNSPISAQATIDGADRQLIIGSGKTGTVVALDAQTGQLVWRTPVGIHQNDDLDAIPDGQSLIVYPAALGGVETCPAYAEGVVYVPVVNIGQAIEGHESGMLDMDNGTGELVALDVTDGSELWKVDLPRPNFGAALVVNDLVVTSDFDGVVYAFDRESGAEVWTYEAPLGINAPLAVAGNTILVPAGTGLGIPVLIALAR